MMHCPLNSILIFSANEVVIVQYFGDCLFEACNLVRESAIDELDAFVPDFQVVM